MRSLVCFVITFIGSILFVLRFDFAILREEKIEYD